MPSTGDGLHNPSNVSGGERGAVYGAAAGAVAVVLFAVSGLLIGERPDFAAGGAEFAAYLDENQARVQLGSALDGAMAPFLVWFLVTVVSLTRTAGAGARRAGAVAFACGLVFLAVFLADVTTLAVGALRPDNMVATPELAAALQDFELLAMGVAAPAAVGMLAAYAVLALRDKAVWPAWLGWLAALAALAYAMRTGTLFSTDGAFAADGVLGFWVPVIAIAAWLFVASVVLALRVRTDTAT